MNEEDKKKFTDLIQKNLTKSCYLKCQKDNKTVISCFQTCYQKYLKAVNTVSDTINQIGYKKHSLIAYKGYPEHNVESLMSLSGTMVGTLSEAPFATQGGQSA